jgi:hypothetical protein
MADVDRERFAALVERVGSFYIRDRAMLRAQRRITAALAASTRGGSGGALDRREVDAYLAAVRRYFCAFAREAEAHLRSVDRRLDRVSQLQFNLTAERGVAQRRVEATQGVLSAVAELG